MENRLCTPGIRVDGALLIRYNLVRSDRLLSWRRIPEKGDFPHMKKILFVASESVPFIKTGGLADVVGSLPKCFSKEYFDVRVIIPKYSMIKEEFKNQMQYITSFYLI